MGVQMGFGIHQLLTAHLWEIDTVAGEQFGEVAAAMPEPNEDFTEFVREAARKREELRRAKEGAQK